MVHVDTYAIHGSSGWWSKNNPVDAERRNQGSVLHSWKVNIYGPLMSLEFYRPRRKVAFQPQFFQGLCGYVIFPGKVKSWWNQNGSFAHHFFQFSSGATTLTDSVLKPSPANCWKCASQTTRDRCSSIIPLWVSFIPWCWTEIPQKFFL